MRCKPPTYNFGGITTWKYLWMVLSVYFGSFWHIFFGFMGFVLNGGLYHGFKVLDEELQFHLDLE